jgi:hypothetical protein
MLWDISIAAAGGLCQFLTAWLGWRITMHPIDLNDPKQKRKRILFECSFILAGVLGVVCVGAIAYRAPREHAQLLMWPGPSRTYNNLPVSWAGEGEHRATFLQINEPLAFSVSWTNVGTGPGWGGLSRLHTFIEPDISGPSEGDAIEKFEKMKSSDPLKCCMTFPKNGNEFATAPGSILSPEDYDNLVFGRRVVYVLAEFVYSDAVGNHDIQYCASLQPPQPGGLVIWGSCSGYNGEKR